MNSNHPKKIVKRPVKITDTTLRDAHQSLIATRLRTDDMIPIAPKIDEVGYWSVEMWGGATFDAMLRYLREDPWERIRKLKAVMPKTPFQMLLRGQNVVGYRNYADDVVEKFVELAIGNGIQILRIFDALNDFRNIKTAIKAVTKFGGKVEGTLCYTVSPVHSLETFVDMAKRLEDMGSDTICIKDMAGILSPYTAQQLVEKIKKATSVPLHLHTHDTSGMAVSTNLKAIEGGVDIIDGAISSLANGTSQPPTEVFLNVLKGGPYDPGLDLKLLAEIAEYFKEVRKKYKQFESEFTGVDPNVLIYQIPGGMTSNLASQLNEQKALGRMKEVLEEVPKVREDLGFPPLVTPSSQIVGTQATLNVLTGERYKVITTETRNYLKGLYGKPPSPINEEVRKRAVGNDEIIEGRPADTLEPELEKNQKENKGKFRSVEDLVSYTLFPKIAMEFFDLREKGEINKPLPEPSKNEHAPPPVPLLTPSEFNIKVHGETYHVKVGGMGHQGEGGRPYFLYLDDQLEEVMVESLMEIVPSEEGRIDKKVGGRSTRPKAVHQGDVTAAMPGTVMKVKVKVGDKIRTGDTILIVEAMKMENEVHSAINGIVKEIYVSEGDKINPDEVLVMVRES
ncbi:MAG: sodium-extruding oxaloacetate decarboxylase subunit alpha [Nitrospiria bacterium]